MIEAYEYWERARNDGVDQGLWVFVDKERKVLIEILFKDGKQILKTETPVKIAEAEKPLL
jgi:hypothetical protein